MAGVGRATSNFVPFEELRSGTIFRVPLWGSVPPRLLGGWDEAGPIGTGPLTDLVANGHIVFGVVFT